MAVYLVSYDLNKPVKDYQKLIDAINRHEKTRHVLKSQWLISSDKTAEQLCNELINFIDENDDLLVCEVNENCAARISDKTNQKFSPRFLPGLLRPNF